MSEPSFLALEEVLELHHISLARYGGGDLFDVAATSAFHIAQAPACLDGNKRTAVAAALMFLKVNGVGQAFDQGKFYEQMIATAERRSGKVELAAFWRKAGSEAQ